MSYASLLSVEGIASQYLIIMKPRYLLTGFTLLSGTKYSKTFSLGQIVKVNSDATTLTEATSSALSDGSWFFDINTNIFYLDIGSDPALKSIVIVYELYFGTFDSYWYRIPDDNTSREVYFEPLIKKSPAINLTVTDSLFGFMPSQSSNVVLSNATHLLQEHLYSSSFNNCDVELWHWLDELTLTNVKLLFKGLCGNVTYNDNDVSILVIDRNQIFKNEFRNIVGSSYYSITDFPNIDPNFSNRPIRKCFGFVDKLVPVNIDYVANNPTTSDNRIWICTNDETNLGSVSTTVPASPASTTTRTYLTSTNGFRVDDTVWIDSSSGPSFDQYVTIIAVGANYIDHETVGTAAASASVVKRSFVGNVKIYKDNELYVAKYGRDFTEYTDGTNKVAGFQFTTTLEANLTLPSNLKTTDLVYCRVYGHKVTATLGGNPFGSNSTTTSSLTNGIVLLYEIIKSYLGLPESDIDTAAFTSLEATITDEIGFVVPYQRQLDFPLISDIITKIAQTLLLKVFLNDDNKWTITQIGPIGTTTKTIEDDEIIKDSFAYSFDYNDIVSDVIINYNRKEVSTRNEISNDSFDKVYQNSDIAKFLHQIKKQKTFESFHFIESEAQILCNRLCFIYGDRNGVVELTTKNRFFDSLIGDEITLTRTRNLGFQYDAEIERSRNLSIVSIQKSLNNIRIELSDQKGIEDNSAGW